MNDTNRRLSADDIDALLPWYAAGTLDARDAEQVKAAVAADAELARRLDLVREEMAEAIDLNESLGSPPARVAEKLFRTIERERRAARGATGGGLPGRLTDFLSPRGYAFAAAAAVLLIVVETGVIARLALQDRPAQSGGYVTASVPRSPEAGAFARVTFSQQASMAEVSHFLSERKAEIVGGPYPGLSYRVRLGPDILPKEDLDRLAREFHSDSSIIASVEAE